MPYIKKENREKLDNKINELAKIINPNDRAGELNYSITKLLLALKGEGKYKDYNELIGALECCKLEFYRRAVADYENQKINTNGDVF